MVLQGSNNPNYKHGKYTKENVCFCGNRKDYRSKKCARCAKRGFVRSDAMGISIPVDILTEVIITSYSFVEAAKRLNVSRQTIKRLTFALNIDTTHFLPSGRARRFSTPSMILIEHGKSSNNVIKACIIRNNLLKYICICGQEPLWKGSKLTLQLHHKNGNPTDHRIENLEFLCPNCHTQTNNFTGRNGKKKSVEVSNA